MASPRTISHELLTRRGLATMKVLILGATGLVGQSTLVQAVTHPAITQVIAPTKKPLPPSSQLANSVAQRLELFLPEVLTWELEECARDSVRR